MPRLQRQAAERAAINAEMVSRAVHGDRTDQAAIRAADHAEAAKEIMAHVYDHAADMMADLDADDPLMPDLMQCQQMPGNLATLMRWAGAHTPMGLMMLGTLRALGCELATFDSLAGDWSEHPAILRLRGDAEAWAWCGMGMEVYAAMHSDDVEADARAMKLLDKRDLGTLGCQPMEVVPA